MHGRSSRLAAALAAGLLAIVWLTGPGLTADPAAQPAAPGAGPAAPGPATPGPATPAPVAAAPPAKAPAPAPSPAADAGEDKDKDKDRSLREQTIYIPYEKLRKVFEKEGRGVFLPYEKYRELWQAAQERKAALPEAKPPVGALITEIENEATVGKDVVRVKAVVKIEVLAEGWHEVPLRLADSAITEATIGGQPARIVSAGPAGYKLLLEKKGKKPEQVELILHSAKGIAKAPGLNSVSFEAPQVPVSRWRIRVPEAGIKVSVQPQIAATEVLSGPSEKKPAPAPEEKKPAPASAATPIPKPAPAPAAEETLVNAYVGAAPTVRIEWTPKAEGATGLEALASVQTEQRVRISEVAIRTDCQLDFSVSRADLRQLTLEIPADQKITNVFDPNVRQWSVQQAGPVQKLTAQLFEPAKQKQSVVVGLERFFDQKQQGPLAIPVVKALGIEKTLVIGRQQGIVVVQVGEGLRGEVTRSGGLLQVDAAELPPALAMPGAFSYRYAAVPFDLQLALEKVQPRILVDSLVEADLQPDRLTLDVLAIYTIERAGVFRLDWEVPPGYEVRQVNGRAAAGATEVQFSTFHHDKDKNRLVVNLARKAMGRVGLHLRLQKDLREPDLLTPGKAVPLPVVLPQVVREGVEQATGRLMVYAPESLQVNFDPDKTKGLRTITFAEALQGVQSTREPAGKPTDSRAVLAFAFAQEPTALVLSAERRKPQVTVEQTLVARIEEGVVKYEATFVYDVLYSGVKYVRIDLPEKIAPDVQNVTPGIRKEDFDPPKIKPAKGYKAWRLSGETELLGSKTIKLAWETKFPKLDVGKSKTLDIPRLQPMEVDRAWGKILLAKVETVDIQDEPGKQEGLRAIDPQEVKLAAGVAGGARAFEFYGDAWELSVTADRYELKEITQTGVERGLLRMVVTRGDAAIGAGRVHVQALYRMKSAEQRLAVQLPGKATVEVQPRINGKPVTLEQGAEGVFYVPLVEIKPNESFLLEIQYWTPGNGSRLEYPDFPAQPSVQQVVLAVYLPREWALLAKSGPWDERFWWRLDDWWLWRPVPLFADHSGDHEATRGTAQPDPVKQAENDVLRWVVQGPGAAPPIESFPTDGRLYLFSALRPVEAVKGALKLTTLHQDVLHALVFAVVLLGGLALVPARCYVRASAAGALVIVLLLCGVFWPIFARQVINGVLAAAVGAVLVVWALVGLGRARPCLVKLFHREPLPPATPPPAVSASAGDRPQSGPQEGDQRHA